MDLLFMWLSFIKFLTDAIPGSATLWVIAAILARIIYTVSFSVILRAQSKRRSLSRRFGKNAYLYWRIGGMTVMHLDAVIIAVAIAKTAGQLPVLQGWFVLLGVVLLFVGVGVKGMATKVLGSGGYMMKDFFYKPKKANLKGVYKYIAHPMYGLGYAHVYGWALMCLSLTGLVLAVFAHIMIHVYTWWAEAPHMKKIYGKKIVKRETSIL